jgi:hypothetical protein
VSAPPQGTASREARLRFLSDAELAEAFVRELRVVHGRPARWSRLEDDMPELAAVLSEFRRRMWERAELDSRHNQLRIPSRY